MRKTRTYRGGAIQKMLLERFLRGGYESIESPSANTVSVGRDNYTLDREISTDRSKVYVKLGANGRPEKVYVVHRGTDSFEDVFNNGGVLSRAFYMQLPRYIEAADVQRKANEKYRGILVNTISHSQGGFLVSCLMYEQLANGFNITMNPAITSRPTMGRMFIIQSEDCPIAFLIRDPNIRLPSASPRLSFLGYRFRMPSYRRMREAHGYEFLGRQLPFTIAEPGDPVPDVAPPPRARRTLRVSVSPIRGFRESSRSPSHP
jgi:hypothetical protein